MWFHRMFMYINMEVLSFEKYMLRRESSRVLQRVLASQGTSAVGADAERPRRGGFEYEVMTSRRSVCTDWTGGGGGTGHRSFVL